MKIKKSDVYTYYANVGWTGPIRFEVKKIKTPSTIEKCKAISALLLSRYDIFCDVSSGGDVECLHGTIHNGDEYYASGELDACIANALNLVLSE